MKQKIWMFTLLLVVSGFLSAEDIPDFRLKNLQQKPVNYSQLKGEKLTVIDFWATWCKPCVRAIPKLVTLYEKYKDQGVAFLGINVDGPRGLSKVLPVSRRLKINYPVLLDENNELMNELNVDAVPTLLIVNDKDEIVAIHKGYRPGDETAIDEEIRKLLTTNTEQTEK